MAKQRIIAYYMHEAEANAARPLMQNAHETESFMVGEVEETDLPRLEAAGVIVQRLDSEAPPLVERRRSARPFNLESDVGLENLRAAPTVDLSRPNYYRLELAGPLLEAWRDELRNRGAGIVGKLSGFALTIRLETEQVAAVRALPFVKSLEMLEGVESGPSELEMDGLRESARTGVRAMIVYDILLRETGALDAVRQWLTDRGVEIAAAAGTKIRIYLAEDSPLEGEIANLADVDRMEPYIAPELHNDQARVLLGIQQANAALTIAQEGDGQVVGVADTGLDDLHPDIPAARRVGVVALGRPGDSTDPHGHGTHVAGSILGDGTASGGQFRGTAPRARLFFQSLLDAQGRLGGLPFRLQDLFDEAYRQGARIHNNSWGAATSSSYRASSNEVDDFAQSHKDMLIVISAGNEGTAADPAPGTGSRRSQAGFVDWLSIGSPATSKNALTVGASQSNRTAGGYSALNYGATWPVEFGSAPPVKVELISGNPESMAAFSSRGPRDDYGIKPDVVAPGTDILSCKSRLAPLRNFWGGHANPDYAYMGGTSMAAPLVSGCAALVREYYVKNRGAASPSAALIKATLINGARRLSAAASIADHPDVPNYHQGFGCVSMPHTIPNGACPAMKLEFHDNWKDPATQFNTTGQRRRFQFTAAAGEPLHICMAYTDPPGRGIQNNLNLLVQDPSQRKWMGNEQLPLSLKIPDPNNNVEIVRLDSPPTGNYLIQITASNLLRPPQDFALVITGDISNFVRIS